ncbi:AAA family ATPase [Chloroflexia bacterium SDU3-3]|nr:AAA family ATPase [Chloroflexia bacterium SDU3-3]
MLYIFAGLPGAGKSTLARQLAQRLNAAYLRVDTIEQALRDAGVVIHGPEGYMIAYRVAGDNLRIGLPVVADTVNPLQITRDAWRAVAAQADAPYVEIEIICSDLDEHRRRVETRAADIEGFPLPTWDDVTQRQFEEWDTTHIQIDTAGQTPAQSIAALEHALTLRS